MQRKENIQAAKKDERVLGGQAVIRACIPFHRLVYPTKLYASLVSCIIAVLCYGLPGTFPNPYSLTIHSFIISTSMIYPVVYSHDPNSSIYQNSFPKTCFCYRPMRILHHLSTVQKLDLSSSGKYSSSPSF